MARRRDASSKPMEAACTRTAICCSFDRPTSSHKSSTPNVSNSGQARFKLPTECSAGQAGSTCHYPPVPVRSHSAQVTLASHGNLRGSIERAITFRPWATVSPTRTAFRRHPIAVNWSSLNEVRRAPTSGYSTPAVGLSAALRTTPTRTSFRCGLAMATESSTPRFGTAR